MPEFTDEQARERGNRFLAEHHGDVPVGHALLTLEQKLDVLKDKLTLAYDERDAAEARLAEAVGALQSIANNSCCEGCQEAKRVAVAALAAVDATQPAAAPKLKPYALNTGRNT